MGDENRDYRAREQMNERIYGVLTALAIVLIVLGITYALWDTGQTNAANTQEARLACITAGNTWVEDSTVCVAMSDPQRTVKP